MATAACNRRIFQMIRLKEYVSKDFTWALSGNIVYSVCQWAIVIVLAKLGTPEDVGSYALGLAVTSPILMLANFQARNLVASDVRNEYSFADYLAFRVASLALALVVIALLAFSTQSKWFAAAIIVLVGLAQSLDQGSETYFGLLQKYDRLDRVALSLMLKGPLCLLLLGLAMAATRNVVWAIAALVVARGLVLFCFDARSASLVVGAHGMEWRHLTQARLLITALPLGIISGIGALNLNIPRYFIEHDLSQRDLGIFSAVASLVGAGNLVMAALASCSIAALAKAWVNRNLSKYRQLSVRMFAASAAMGGIGVLVAVVAGDRVLTLFFGSEYAGSLRILALVMVAGAVGYVVSAQGYAMTAARQLLPQIPLLLATAAVTTASAWWLVPRRGLAGAAEAWLLGAIFQLALSSAVMAHLGRAAKKIADLQAATSAAACSPD